MKTKTLSMLTLFPLFLLACSGITTPAPTVEPPPAAIATASLITAEGKLVPYRATELYFVQPGIVAEVLVQPGDQVAEGQVIARLESIETLQAELAAARLEQLLAQQELDWQHEDANLAAAQALKSLADAQDVLQECERVLNNMQSPAKQTFIDQAQAAVVLSKHELDQVKKDFKPYEKKSERNLVRAMLMAKKAQAQQAYDDAVRHLNQLQAVTTNEIDLAQAEADLVLAQAQLQKMQRDYETLKEGPDPDKLAAAESRLEAANAQVIAIEATLANYELRAPFAGTVLSLEDISVGEAASPGIPVAFLGDTSRWLVETKDLAEIYISSVSVGKTATVELDALPGEVFAGEITEINPVGREYLGDMTYKVTVTLVQAETRFKWNMTATVGIGSE